LKGGAAAPANCARRALNASEPGRLGGTIRQHARGIKMRAFRQVAFAFGSVLLCSSFALGQASLGPYVIDSNGLKVGRADLGGRNVLMFIDGHPAILSVGPNGFYPGPSALYFTDAACGTQALLDVGQSGLIISPGFYTTDGMVHYVNPLAVANADIQSSIPMNSDGTLGPCGPTVTSMFAAPALSGPATGGPAFFTPPFSVVESLPVSPAPPTATFNDVPTTHPFFQFIEALHASGITAGCSAAPPLYCPDNPVTRAQMAVFLAKALGL